MRDLKDRVAVVTGGGAGIGRALCHELAREGAHLVVADIDEASASKTASEVVLLGRRAIAAHVDVRNPGSVEALLARAVSELGSCHLAFNNAGVFHAASLLDTPLAQWQRVIETNLWGVLHGSRIFGAHFVQQGEGHIVNTSSAAGLFPMPGMGPYSTTKFALVGFTKQLRWELAARNVGVTLLCPGTIRTGIGKADGVGLDPTEVDKMTARAPLPEQLARKVVRAVRKNRSLVRLGPDAYVLSLLALLPEWLLDPLGRFMGRTAMGFLDKSRSPRSPSAR